VATSIVVALVGRLTLAPGWPNPIFFVPASHHLSPPRRACHPPTQMPLAAATSSRQVAGRIRPAHRGWRL